MATDIQLSGDFWLHEAPCWQHATEAQVEKLQETAARVLQPIRSVFGTTYISSWMWWRSGCVPRTGAHSMGGTVDIDVPGKNLEVWEWGNSHLLQTGYVGRWIYEPKTPTQGEHIHMAPRADMLELNGDGRIQSLKELPGGGYYLALELTEGSYLNPYTLPGITAVGTRRAGIPWWVGAGVLLAALGARGRPA